MPTSNRSALAKLIRACAAPSTPATLEISAPLLAHPQLIAAFHRAGWFAAVVDRAPVFNKDTLLHAIYQSCALPAYFGFNWDALVDGLSDLPESDSKHPPKGYALILKAPALLQQRAPEDFATFLNIIAEVNARYAGEGRPFRLLLGV